VASTQHAGAGAYVPPPRPDAAARKGLDRALLPCATTTPEPRRPPQPRPRAHRTAATRPPCAATRRREPPPPRPRALTTRCRESERDPAPVVGGASFAQPRPPTEVGGERGGRDEFGDKNSRLPDKITVLEFKH
jgi:hypothetical protein